MWLFMSHYYNREQQKYCCRVLSAGWSLVCVVGDGAKLHSMIYSRHSSKDSCVQKKYFEKYI